MKVLAVVEDDPDVAFLVETIFSMDSRFTVAAVADSAEQSFTTAPKSRELSCSTTAWPEF